MVQFNDLKSLSDNSRLGRGWTCPGCGDSGSNYSDWEYAERAWWMHAQRCHVPAGQMSGQEVRRVRQELKDAKHSMADMAKRLKKLEGSG